VSKFGIELSGVTPEELSDALGKLAKAAPKEFDKLLHQEAEAILAEARPITPVDRDSGGRLRKSGRVDVRAKGYTVGFYQYYAAAVHEMGFGPATKGQTFNWSAPNTGAKYLEKPYKKRKQTMVKRMLTGLMEFSMGLIRRTT